MTATIIDNLGSTNLTGHIPGDKFEANVEISFAPGDTYPTNGFKVSDMLAGLAPITKVTHFMPSALGPTLDGTVNQFSYDKANGKVKLYNAATEVNNGVNVSAYKLYAEVRGNR